MMNMNSYMLSIMNMNLNMDNEKDINTLFLKKTSDKVFLIVSPSAKIVYRENIGFLYLYPAMSMMVIGPSLLY